MTQKTINRSVTSRRLRICPAPLLLWLAVLACSLPQGALTTPTSSQAQPTPPPEASSTPVTSPTPLPPTLRASATPRGAPHRIELRRVYGIASFYDRQTGQAFTPRGVNYFYLVPADGVYENRILGAAEFDAQRTQQDFQRIHQAGFNTVRVIFDLCRAGPECSVADGQSGMNPDYLDSLAQLMRLAQENEMLLILASNGLPPGSKYARQASMGVDASFAAGRNASLLTVHGIQAGRAYWSDLLKGLAARQAPFETVLGWELLNEGYFDGNAPPFSLSEGRVTSADGKVYDLSDPAHKSRLALVGMRYYIQQMRQAINSTDPRGLVTMGFFAPVTPHAWRESDPRYVETGGLLDQSELDFFDFHLYPGSSLSQAELVENFALPGHAEKPVLMGETGAYTALYATIETAARALQDWIAASCQFGFDGWLAWGYYRAPGELGDTAWGFTDGDELLMKAISPAFQPDACVTSVLRGDNLALGKPVSASTARSDYPPEAAVDGTWTRWNSGLDAPQWIEIDLGSEYAIGVLRLTVDQWPDGETVHEIWTAGEDARLQRLDELQGWTRDGQVLEWSPEKALSGVRYVRIVTTQSPSWVGWEEIEVLAP